MRMSEGQRRRIGIGLAALALLAGCSSQQKQDAAEREFNAWANQVDQDNANGQADAQVGLDEPANILAGGVPANAQ
jgi:outer membrane murein-binding lipoprotein Lpp